jgi:hypothetical protein
MKQGMNSVGAKKISRALCAIAVIGVTGSVQPALALDRTWVGPGYWEVAKNWSPTGIPASSDRAIIKDGVSILSTNTAISGLEFSAGELAGNGNLTIIGPGIWSGGKFSGRGTTQFAGPLYITGNAIKGIEPGKVISVTDTTWGNNTALDSNIIQFAPGGGSSGISNIGTWNDTNAFSTQIRSDHIYPSTFHNIGTYNKQGNGVTIIEANYNNTGTTNVSAGSLGLSGGGSSTGVFNIATNSKLEFLGGTHYLNEAATSGAGTLHIRGNSMVNVNGGKHSTPLAISQDGQLQGANTFDGPVTWTGGSINGGGLTVFAESLSITGDMEKKIDGGHIVGVRDTAWGGNTRKDSNQILINSGFTINNPASWLLSDGTWNDTNTFDSAIGGPNSTFINNGIYRKQGDGVTIIGANYDNTGTTEVNTGKMVVAHSFSNSGEIVVSAGATFQVLHVPIVSPTGINSETDTKFENAISGELRGIGTIITPPVGLTNRGAINPGHLVGDLTIDGDLHQAASGVLNIELASLTRFDQLAVTDDVTFGGTLAISNEGYTPAIGDRFVVVTFDERLADSTFSSIALNGFGPAMNFDVIYNEHDVTLAVTAIPQAIPVSSAATVTAVPEPGGWAMLLAGLALVGHMARRRTLILFSCSRNNSRRRTRSNNQLRFPQ